MCQCIARPSRLRLEPPDKQNFEIQWFIRNFATELIVKGVKELPPHKPKIGGFHMKNGVMP